MSGFDAVSRRRFITVGGVGTLAVLLSSACGDRARVTATQIQGPPSGLTAAPPGPGSVERGRPGGSVVTAWTAEGNSYDAAIGYDLHSWEALTSLLYLPLYRFAGQGGGAAPAAAAAMPEISADGTRYLIRLRPDFKFHNGRPIVARDYIYAWRRVLDPATESWAAPYFASIKGADAITAGTGTELTGVTALDDHTLVVELAAPDITFLGQLAQPYAAALPKEEVERLGDRFGRTPVGNGPFMITDYDTTNQRSVFERNPYFPWPGLPFLDRVTYRWGIEPALQFLQLQHGDVDILGEGLTPSIAARVQGNTELRERYTVPIPTLGAAWVAINMASDKLADPRVRQALNWATDRDQLAKFSRGLQISWGAVIPEREPDYRRTVTPYTFDPDRAKSLMRDAGVHSLELNFYCNEDDYWINAGQVLQQQWAPIGVNLRVTTLSNAAFWTAVENGEADVFGRNYFQVQPTGLDLLGGNFTTSGSSNYQKYSNPDVDELAVRSQGSLTVEESNQHLAAAEAIVAHDAPGVFTGSLNFVSMRSPRVQNYHLRCETGSYYDRMWV
jgi:peptide/nickel transport system substrate-binding protein